MTDMEKIREAAGRQDCTSDVFFDFLYRADRFVESLMSDYQPQQFSQNKVIHDCVWGTVMFYPWELQIIDSPLLQRLRLINQLGLAVLTYPSAHHSRFEHTLGVVAVVSQMVSGVNHDENSAEDGRQSPIPRGHIRILRLAALLHDVGHCFFSHLSESIYGQYSMMKRLRETEPVFASAQPHEILGYIIINTPSFRRFFREQTGYPFEKESADSVLLLVGRMIVGALPEVTDGVRYSYLTEMINGQFDADALDYLRRDSYATGLALTYHIDRFLYKLRIADKIVTDPSTGENVKERHLTVPVSGISTVEEMVFSKLMLSRYIYQHQKVLAVESMAEDLVDGMRRGGRLSHPCDFLTLCDNDIYAIGSRQRDDALRPAAAGWRLSDSTRRTVGDVAERVLLRRLPKKAMVLNLGNIARIGDMGAGEFEVGELVDALRSIPDLRQKITAEAQRCARELGIPVPEIYDVHISVPRISMAKNFSRTPVLTYDGNFIPMSKVVDLNDWAGSFAGHSYNAYIFSDRDSLPAVSVAALRVLRDNGILCDRGMIFSGLKESAQIEDACKKLGE